MHLGKLVSFLAHAVGQHYHLPMVDHRVHSCILLKKVSHFFYFGSFRGDPHPGKLPVIVLLIPGRYK